MVADCPACRMIWRPHDSIYDQSLTIPVSFSVCCHSQRIIAAARGWNLAHDQSPV